MTGGYFEIKYVTLVRFLFFAFIVSIPQWASMEIIIQMKEEPPCENID